MRKSKNLGVGRPKGSVNKVTRTIKEAMLLAHDAVGAERFWKRLADKSPEVFAQCICRLIPAEVAGQLDVNLNVTIKKIMTLASSPELPRASLPALRIQPETGQSAGQNLAAMPMETTECVAEQ
jgi:hypothetical protein